MDIQDFQHHYLEILNGPLAGLNLTRIKDPKDFKKKHIDDLLNAIEASKYLSSSLNENDLVIDVGFGGGFPLLPLSVLYRNKSFIGLEARKKKAKAVNDIAEILGLEHVRCFHQRADDIFFDQPCLITFKAVGKIKDCLKWIKTDSKVQTVFFKGPSPEKLEDIRAPENWKLIEKSQYLIGPEEGRTLLIYENVPRGTVSKPNKNLVKLSDLNVS